MVETPPLLNGKMGHTMPSILPAQAGALAFPDPVSPRPGTFFVSSSGCPLPLEGTYHGSHAFLVANGPSLVDLDLSPLKSRWSMTLNNGPRTFRGNANTMGDNPAKFSLSMWLDPTMMKFIPADHFDRPLWDNRLLTHENGVRQKWQPSKLLAGACPNVVGYRLNESFQADRWLAEDTINWGDDDTHGGGRSVLLASLKILFLLGFRHVYLLGVDFEMSDTYRYHFSEDVSIMGIQGNLSTYAKLQQRLAELQPHFLAADFVVKNCNPKSRLSAFPNLRYADALAASVAFLGDCSAERTEGMYRSPAEKLQPVNCNKTGSGRVAAPHVATRTNWLSPLQRRGTKLPGAGHAIRTHWLSPLERSRDGVDHVDKSQTQKRSPASGKDSSPGLPPPAEPAPRPSWLSPLQRRTTQSTAFVASARTCWLSPLQRVQGTPLKQDTKDRANDRCSLRPAIPVAVIVTCHAPYLKRLPKAISSINRQSLSFGRKILVLDSVGSFSAPSSLNGWQVVHCWARSPNVARNLGIQHVGACPWVVHWDADNAMPPQFLEHHLQTLAKAHRQVGFIYPSLQYVNDVGRAVGKLQVPDWDHWSFREKTYVDSSSLWKVQAIRSVGGWSRRQPRLDDWELSLRLIRAGWIGKKSRATVTLTSHPERRSRTADRKEAVWQARSIGLLTLWSGRSPVTDRLLEWYAGASLPPHTSIYWMDNSGDSAYAAKLATAAHLLRRRVECFSLLEEGGSFERSHDTAETDWLRHQHVASLYNRILPRISDDLVLFLEDDNLPPLTGLRELSDVMLPGSGVAGVGGAYRSRKNPALCCAALQKERWAKCPGFDSLPDSPIEVGMMGGGFTLYSNCALRKAMPMICTRSPANGALQGWDANLGRTLSSLGYKLLLHGGVRAEHHCAEVLEYLACPHAQEAPL